MKCGSIKFVGGLDFKMIWNRRATECSMYLSIGTEHQWQASECVVQCSLLRIVHRTPYDTKSTWPIFHSKTLLSVNGFSNDDNIIDINKREKNMLNSCSWLPHGNSIQLISRRERNTRQQKKNELS